MKYITFIKDIILELGYLITKKKNRKIRLKQKKKNKKIGLISLEIIFIWFYL